MQKQDTKLACRPLAIVCAEIALRVAEWGLTQKEIERDTGVDQGQVSRILKGQVLRLSPNVLKLCEYAKIDPYLHIKYDPTDDFVFMEVIESAVAGSSQRAQTIARVVKAVGRALDSNF